ncbi:hypothetical protein [Microbulbifer hydrolyticus]|uniref:Uncharacterized protein n=1 Tax=Microbulbifer hydrolyticus TaxID=48074 RepID=A0AA89PBD4_9GAMM|nr:hypothetical protein [Microbulbifer hydrolyticus]MBB5211055.1 hypothetical protein [Microbulbifer hydrolyticus]
MALPIEHQLHVIVVGRPQGKCGFRGGIHCTQRLHPAAAALRALHRLQRVVEAGIIDREQVIAVGAGIDVSTGLLERAMRVLGAEIWLKKSSEDLAKCDALITLLESPELENGSIVWNRDNGWNLTNNAAVMTGLIDVETIEAENKSTALPSLDELIALNNRFGG